MAESCFKAYDIRGRVPDQLNTEVAYLVGQALVSVLKAKTVVVGYDIRLSSPDLTDALIQGVQSCGGDVSTIGLCGTECIYFSTAYYDFDIGVMITASHNPEDYNGIKFIAKGGKPISRKTGLDAIEAFVFKQIDSANAELLDEETAVASLDWQADYINHLLSYIQVDHLKPLKIVVNPGNGGAGEIIDALENNFPFEFIKVNYEPNGDFPNGVPNPLLAENRFSTQDAVLKYKADLGIAWDGDYDRCFFFDEKGNFIEGYYIVGLLAEAFLQKSSKSQKIVYDTRLTWNTIDIARFFEGEAIQSKTGHAFIKQKMRDVDAVYGGEMSAHHYFKDFFYCDSGMIPWLLIAELLSVKNCSLSSLVNDRQNLYPCSGEINFKVKSTQAVLSKIENFYRDAGSCLDKNEIDGLSMEFSKWRFNVRASNTEPLLRLNVESRNDSELMQEKKNELCKLIKGF